jgi:predicted DNA-binding transcriptional regulator AlpA
MSNPQKPYDLFFLLPEVMRLFGMSAGEVWENSDNSSFPKPVRLLDGNLAWHVNDIICHADACGLVHLGHECKATDSATDESRDALINHVEGRDYEV